MKVVKLTEQNYDTILPIYVIESCNVNMSRDVLRIERPATISINNPILEIDDEFIGGNSNSIIENTEAQKIRDFAHGTCLRIKNEHVCVDLHVVDSIIDGIESCVSMEVIVLGQGNDNVGMLVDIKDFHKRKNK